MNPGIGYLVNVTSDLQREDIMPWAQQIIEERQLNLQKDDPYSVSCLPRGPRQLIGIIGTPLMKVVQTQTLITILFETLEYRQIFLDGRELPSDPNPSFMGYSIGRWEGDTLVVDSNGFNDRTWLDFGGRPHSESLRMTERWSRRDFGHIDLQVSYEDSKTYTKRWTIPVNVTLRPDTDLLENVCQENEKSSIHVLRQPEDRWPTLAPQILSSYVGRYEPESSRAPARSLVIRLDGGHLVMDVDGKGGILLLPVSDTRFTTRITDIEFTADARGTMVLVGFNDFKFFQQR